MSDAMFDLLGWRALLIHGDPCVLDRWLWLRRHLRSGRTFDAGCGNGGFTIYAALQGNEVLAASFSAAEQEAAKRRAQSLGLSASIDFRVIDLREIEQQRAALGSFSQIICFETIEHLLDDEGLVRSLAAMLEPGGRLLLTAPFDGHRPLFSEDPDPDPVEDGLHVRFGYSQARLREVIEQAGLRTGEEGFVSGVVSQKLTDLMRRLTNRFGLKFAWPLLLPLRALVLLDRPLSAVLRYPYLSVAAVAIKPA